MSYGWRGASAVPAVAPLGLLAAFALASHASADILAIGIRDIKGSDSANSNVPGELQPLGFSLASTRIDVLFTIDTDQPHSHRYTSQDRTGRLYNTLNDRYAAGEPTGGSLFVTLDIGGVDRLIISGSYSSADGFMMNGWAAENDQFVLEGPRGILGDGSLAAVLNALRNDSFSIMRASFALSNIDTRDEIEATLVGAHGDYAITVVPGPGTISAVVGVGLVGAVRRRRKAAAYSRTLDS